MKKIIVSLLTVCMLFSICSVSVFAREGDNTRVPLTVTEASALTLEYYDDVADKSVTVDIKAATALGYYELVLPYGIDLDNTYFSLGTDKIMFDISEEHQALWGADDQLLERYYNNLRTSIWKDLSYCKGDSTEYTNLNTRDIKLEDGQTYTVSLGSEYSAIPKNDDEIGDTTLGPRRKVTLTGSIKFAFKVRVDGPSVIKGASHTLTKGDNADLATELDEELSKFVKVVYNNKTLEKGVDYTATQGSTVITLKNSFLKTLDIGTHNIYVYFEDGTSVIPVTVKAATNDKDNKNPTDTEKNDEDDSETKKDVTLSPKTGNTATPFVIVISVITALIATAVVYKKIKN